MEYTRPKISSCSSMELAALLKESFFKIGKEVKLSSLETKIFIDEVYKNHGSVYVDSFSEAFSQYAALELPDCENLRPQVSPLFISRLMKIYTRKYNESKYKFKSLNGTSSILTPEQKYVLFVKFINANKVLPANPDWIMIYEYLSNINKLPLPNNWNTISYYPRWKHARNEVTDWAYKTFNITELLLYKKKDEKDNKRKE
jgi:hypothetical protein